MARVEDRGTAAGTKALGFPNEVEDLHQHDLVPVHEVFVESALRVTGSSPEGASRDRPDCLAQLNESG